MNNVVDFPVSDEATIRRDARQQLAAAVAILAEKAGPDDLERCLHNINEAWGQVAALLILRLDP